MSPTRRSNPAPSTSLPAAGGSRRRCRRAVSLAAVAALTVLGPGTYAASAMLTAPAALAAKGKHHSHKPKPKCKKGFVYQHGKCVGSTRPVY
jgi:hypothetical protein